MEEEIPPKLSEKEIVSKLANLTGWELGTAKFTGFPAITKRFKFKNFKEAISFINKVAETAENYQHHPEIHLVTWNNVIIEVYTHIVSGLSKWDFELAELIDKIK